MLAACVGSSALSIFTPACRLIANQPGALSYLPPSPFAGVALDCPAQIIFYCLLDHPFVITSWQAWAARLRSLPSRAR